MTKGNKRSWPFGFCACLRANCQEAKLTPDRDLSMMFSGYPPSMRRCLNFKRPSSNVFFRRVSSKQSHRFAFNETVFYIWWVTEGEVRKLEGLGRLVMGFDVQDGIFCESFPFKHRGIEKSDLVLWYFGREFDSRVEIVSSFNKPIYLFFIAIPMGENVIYVTFPFSWLGFALMD